jgi:DNA-binding CsgD family transcriptional regulator
VDQHAHALSELAQLIATDPDPGTFAAHLHRTTFAASGAQVITIYLQMESDEGTASILVGQSGLTEDESARYAHINADFPLPAAEALQHTFPYSLNGQEVDERYPSMRVRPEFQSDLGMLVLPMTMHGTTVGATVATLNAPVQWDPDMLNFALAIQALLGIYLRVTDRVWMPIRPLSPDLTVFQGLTARQRTILQLVREGRSTSAIAARLGFSEATIKQDIRRAMVALEVPDRQQAVQRAVEFGLLSTP